jgi:urocanate hydratase
MLMILNNLDPEVAQYLQELVTYGGNGQVFSNWAQVRRVVAILYEILDFAALLIEMLLNM